MDKKIISIISYFSIIGWVIAFVFFNNGTEKASLAKYHLKQAFGLAILGVLVSIGEYLTLSLIPAFVSTILNLILLVLAIIGIVNAVKEEEKPLPLIGEMFVNKFDFI